MRIDKIASKPKYRIDEHFNTRKFKPSDSRIANFKNVYNFEVIESKDQNFTLWMCFDEQLKSRIE